MESDEKLDGIEPDSLWNIQGSTKGKNYYLRFLESNHEDFNDINCIQLKIDYI